MRVEPFGVDSIVHVIKRGAHGGNIVSDNDDHARFARSLFYLNDTYTDSYWHRTVAHLPPFEWPGDWPEREPLVRILGWTLLSNHFHLLLQEIREGGVAKFMQRLCGSMSTCFNAKYQEQGSLFQGPYRARLVSSDEQLRYLVFYILVKNVLDARRGGVRAALSDFNDAWDWAKQYPHSSLRDCISGGLSPVTDDPDGLIHSVIGAGNSYKKEARELLAFHINAAGGDLKEYMLEPW